MQHSTFPQIFKSIIHSLIGCSCQHVILFKACFFFPVIKPVLWSKFFDLSPFLHINEGFKSQHNDTALRNPKEAPIQLFNGPNEDYSSFTVSAHRRNSGRSSDLQSSPSVLLPMAHLYRTRGRRLTLV